MRITNRSALCISLALSGFLSQQTKADVLYSVTNLGPNTTAGPTPYAAGYPGGSFAVSPGQGLYDYGNYLGALSQSQQAAYQSGSFDIYAHPATAGNLPVYYQTGDIVPPQQEDPIQYSANLTTSNNVGVSAGTAETRSSYPAYSYFSAVTFTSDPHTVSVQNPFGPSWSTTTETSPGYLGTIPNSSAITYGGNFYGAVAGINDYGNIAMNEYTWPASADGYAVVAPHLIMGSTGKDISLGTLGGLNAAVYALNNSSQVVGWSQIASGAQHAFLYSNGTMQDLNLLIPPLPGITLTSAVGIDAAGEIVAFGTDASGQTNEYFLTPLESSVPEPSSLAIMGLMIVAVAARQTYSRWQSKR